MSRYLHTFCFLFSITSIVVYSFFDSHRTHYYVFLLGGYSLFGLIVFKRLNQLSRLVVLNLLFVFLSELTVRLLIHHHIESYPIYHLFIPVQIAFYGFIYAKISSIPRKRLFFVIVASLMLISLLTSIFIQKINYLPSIGFILLSCFAIPLSLLKFTEMINSPISRKLNLQTVFWFNLGTFFFYSITFFIYSFFPFISEGPDWVYDLPWFANIYFYTFYFISLVVSLDQRHSL